MRILCNSICIGFSNIIGNLILPNNNGKKLEWKYWNEVAAEKLPQRTKGMTYFALEYLKIISNLNDFVKMLWKQLAKNESVASEIWTV